MRICLPHFSYQLLIVYFFIGAACGLLFIGCGQTQDAAQLSGKDLAKTYCASCHQFPEPNLLPKQLWETKILPKMGLRLGILSDTASLANQMTEQEDYQHGIKMGVFPAQPVLARADWLKLVRYYLENAPKELPRQAAKSAIAVALPLFQVHKPKQPLEALITGIGFDSSAQEIILSNRRGLVYWLSPKLQGLDSVSVGSAAASIQARRGGQVDLLSMGIMDPNDDSVGSWMSVQRANKTPKLAVVVPKLHRPVDAAFADFNRDGQEDMVVCQFGHLTGKLSWFERKANTYQEHVLEAVPGARRVVVRDVNRDGWPDLVVLLTQGDEQVAIYYNEKNGTSFRKETVLRFPPVYGSSYFELADIDQDGDEDLIYTNGDNADYSYALKPYHGIRIYQNDGHFRFKQAWFYPLYGATQSQAGDFDGDGDIDFATIAFFPDFAQKPLENFVYFENKGNLKFAPQTFAGSDQGRWLTIKAADVDQDGDLDVLLGSFFRAVSPTPPDFQERWRQAPGVFLLENKRY
ncbi:FG-GAP repeat domain-containing protein [Tellurirhabdus bombi]|uniref:FG-GAP repeat domain-containing protein n=1 Tax=Tellurirhabdus bombi TaxID=2907205 RepID=UPI001F1D3753|nr:VCBS repeat-containing protein [Tellurirhabdus bombi]